MKSVTFELLHTKFDEIYSFELQGYLSYQDFCVNMKTMNRHIKSTPLPRHKQIWVIILWTIWMVTACLCYIVYMQDLLAWIAFLLPCALLALTVGLNYYYHCRTTKFEVTAMEACEKINELENTRGVHYELLKNSERCINSRSPFSWYFLLGGQSSYALSIQFDDRYNQQCSKEFVSVPLYTEAPTLLNEEKMNDVRSPFLKDSKKITRPTEDGDHLTAI